MLLLITLLKDNMNRLYKDISYTLILFKHHILWTVDNLEQQLSW